ncbi:serine palmitoyltransferase [Coniophora puteana RWD-64-598 SS2]|uniref:serine C-palmitoyltransferase n=1 Tax=Coniophora puteana (strain RWD-64-598) TaxID=741705 RepID=A0A5M3MKR1_CONPW|nr:serine palmitoyltransferase [Coniophora puteana RWD-64-598 SS2]EIW79758.1 serine palmitoyltransferase [Coniophora puteana RWD-64-598 SS2]
MENALPSSSVSSTLEPVLALLAYSLTKLETGFYQIPGSAVVARYVKSSHQNDPGRTILEVILIIFAIRTLLQSRTRSDRGGKHYIQFGDKEVDELVDEWTPEPLAQPLTEWEQKELASIPVIAGPNGPKPKLVSTGKTVTNLASYNFTGLAGNEHIKERAVDTLRKYGLGSCGPPGFYGTIDVHMDLEKDIAEFLGAEAAILYSQGYSTVSSVIPAFCKRGDIIVADRGVNYAIQKGIQLSRSTVRWFDHNDLRSLEDALQAVERDRKKRKGPLTRRFIITEGIFERDGEMVDLPKIIELKNKYKYRLILDESISFGTVGRTGRGLTELYNVPASQIDMLVGSVANGLCSSGGFCAGSTIVVEHQRINGTSFVFSASMPALLAVSGSEAITYLRNTPSTLSALQENIRALRAVLEKTEGIAILGHRASPIVHFSLRSVAPASLSPASAATPAGKESFDVDGEERILQEIVEDALANGVMLTRAKYLRKQEMFEPRPTIRIAMTSALTRKEVEKAAGVVKASIARVLSRRR